MKLSVALKCMRKLEIKKTYWARVDATGQERASSKCNSSSHCVFARGGVLFSGAADDDDNDDDDDVNVSSNVNDVGGGGGAWVGSHWSCCFSSLLSVAITLPKTCAFVNFVEHGIPSEILTQRLRNDFFACNRGIKANAT